MAKLRTLSASLSPHPTPPLPYPSRRVPARSCRPGAGSGSRPTSEVHLQLSLLTNPSFPLSLSLSLSLIRTEILDDNTDRWCRPYTPGIQIRLLSFSATSRPFGFCDRLSLSARSYTWKRIFLLRGFSPEPRFKVTHVNGRIIRSCADACE